MQGNMVERNVREAETRVGSLGVVRMNRWTLRPDEEPRQDRAPFPVPPLR